ncbi:hypothetical protein TWF730_004681 [Orbilia blumenaviensis]|uniref:BAH domain-containing protein n=1 Tax=Orbilia blumenaviensis TaxID=1796055 RepID=A0AAV9TWY1_9PEZI
MALKRKRSNSSNQVLDDDILQHEPPKHQPVKGKEVSQLSQGAPSSSSSISDLEVEGVEFKITIKGLKQARNKQNKQTPRYKADIIDNLIINPQEKWDKLKSFGGFSIVKAEFKRGDIVEIKRPRETGDPNEKKEWIARVLDVRASDKHHVYLRIAWFYWPEDLPMGRQEYHGRNEVIESNHPDIIVALSVNCLADIKEWDEDDEEAVFDGLYYRQQFDYISQQLTTPKKICVCEEYYNPDTRLVNCPQCKIWMHEQCITEDAVRRHKKSSIVSRLSDKSKSEPDAAPAVVPKKKPNRKPKGYSKKAKTFSQTPTPGPDQSVAATILDGKIRIKEVAGKKNEDNSDSGLDVDNIVDEDIRCLSCGVVIS